MIYYINWGVKMKLTIKLNSVTYALKANALLRSRNIKSEIKKNPKPRHGEGCGYLLNVRTADESILDYLRENGVEIIEAVWE